MGKPTQGRDSNATTPGRNRSTATYADRDRYVDETVVVLDEGVRRPTITPTGFCMLLAGFFLFKAIVLTHLGAEKYLQVIERLENGTYTEQAGAFIMNVDVATLFFANEVIPLFN